MKSVCLKNVAQAAGVSLATASTALSGNGRVSADTRRRVEAVARRLGYARDPLLGALSAYRRRAGSTPRTPRGQLAFLTNSPTETALSKMDWARDFLGCSREAARRLGYGLQVYPFTPDNHASPESHTRVLLSRGVCGVIVGAFVEGGPSPALDWNAFACVALGDNQPELSAPRARFDHYLTMRAVCAALRVEGVARPALIISEAHHRRHHGQTAAAFLVEAHAAKAADLSEVSTRIHTFKTFDPSACARWLRQTRPDCVVAVTPGVADAVAPLLTRDEELVCFGRSAQHRSIEWPHPDICAAAVQMLHQRIVARVRGFTPAREHLDFIGTLGPAR